MNKVFLVWIFSGAIIQSATAQNLNFNKKNYVKSNKFQLQEMPKLNCGTSLVCEISLPSCGVLPFYWYNATIPSTIMNDYIFHDYPRPTFKFQHNMEYSNEDIMKLPAVNTYDIIKILDTDRRLTNW